MPIEVYNEEGQSMGEMPTEDELKELNEKAGKVEDLQSSITEMEGKIKGFEDEPTDVKVLRQSHKELKVLKKQLEENKLRVDKEGKINENKELTPEDLEKKVTEGVNKQMIKLARTKLLSKYNEDQQKVLSVYLDRYEKAGDLNAENVNEIMSEAERAAGFATPERSSTNTLNGAPPNIDTKSMTSEQKELGTKMGLSKEDMDKYGGATEETK